MTLEVDLALVQKYQRPGPRYTSYPTAPHFSEFDHDAWMEKIRESNRTSDRSLSLYFHLPYCDALCYFCGCNMIVSRDPAKNEEYLDYLFREMDLVKDQIHTERKVVQQHFGGGTPTHLTPDEIRRLGAKIREIFHYSNDAEIGIEIDPRELTREHVRALREIGGNRASLGVQDHNPEVQDAVHRVQPRELVQNAVSWLREDGFGSINIDLMYGLPHQTVDSFRSTLEEILELRPDRLAVFNYAHVPWMKPHQKLIKEEHLPDGPMKLAMLKDIIETLTSRGYVYIGMDHFALENDELTISQREKTLRRNFQGYSTKSGAEIYSFGMSAISQLDTVYAQNVKDLPTYFDRIAKRELPVHLGFTLSDDDLLRREVIETLMCDLELDYGVLSERTGVDFPAVFSEELDALGEFEEDGLLEREPGRILVTEPGRLFIRNIAMTFDAHLGNAKERYSKTV